MKKAYYKLSLSVHPDRVPVNEKKSATAKFQVLGKVYSVLSDKDKRTLYDQTGKIENHSCDSSLCERGRLVIHVVISTVLGVYVSSDYCINELMT